jgi:ABC-type multidrug transport system fused ATPase/permease subunit
VSEPWLGTATPARAREETVRLLRASGNRALAAAGASLVAAVATAAAPLLLGSAIDAVRAHDLGAVHAAGLGLAAVCVVAPAALWTALRIWAEVGEAALGDLRLRATDRVLALDLATLDREGPGRLLSRLTGDVDELRQVFGSVLPSFGVLALAVPVAVASLLVMAWPLALVVLAAVALVVVPLRRYLRGSRTIYDTARRREADVLAGLRENLEGVSDIQSLRAEERRVAAFQALAEAPVEVQMRAAGLRNRLRVPVLLCRGFALLGTLALGAVLEPQGAVSLGAVAATGIVILRIFGPLQEALELLVSVQAAGASFRRVLGLLDAPVRTPATGNASLPRRGTLRTDAVAYSYRTGDMVLRDVDIQVAPGERVALVGATGAGKSTLARLLAGLDEPTRGRVSFAGVDRRDADPAAFRARVAFLPQADRLFAGTIADDVRLARPDATDGDVLGALQAVGAGPLVAALPDGLLTPTGAAATLSAGERQLIALARIALLDPAVLVLDEVTSVLDPAAERRVEEALRRLGADRAIVLIVHRLPTAARADRIAVLTGGRIAEQGTHAELLAARGAYWEAWAGEEQLAGAVALGS